MKLIAIVSIDFCVSFELSMSWHLFGFLENTLLRCVYCCDVCCILAKWIRKVTKALCIASRTMTLKPARNCLACTQARTKIKRINHRHRCSEQCEPFQRLTGQNESLEKIKENNTFESFIYPSPAWLRSMKPSRSCFYINNLRRDCVRK